MMRRLAALLMAATFLLSGCWSRREMNDLGAVVSVGIDLTDDGKLDVTFAVIQPSATTGGSAGGQGRGTLGRGRVALRRQGITFADAMQQAERASARRLAMDHVQIIILGERFANHGIDALLDYLFRSPENRLSTRVMLVEGSTPSDVLTSTPLLRSTQAETLRELESTRAGLMITLKDLFVARSQPHLSPLVSLIRLRPHVGTEDSPQTNEVELAGAAVFRKGRTALRLHGEELQAAIWFRTDARKTVITAPCPDEAGKYLSARVLRGTHRIVPVWDGRQLSFRVDLSGQISIIDMQCNRALTSPSDLQTVAVPIQQNLVRSVTQTLKRLQSEQVDPFGFGEQVRVHLPALWRQVGGERWPKTWSEVPVKVSSNLTVTHQNLSTEAPSHQQNSAKD